MTADAGRNPLNPLALDLPAVAQILSKASGQPVLEKHLRDDVAAGAPTNQDGSINLVHYAAWLVKEMADAAGDAHA